MSNNTPLVSIITPTFNHEKYIQKCIRSVIEQEYQNWEMIVIDDGSTDTTLDIARYTAGNDERIQVLTQENRGLLRLDETYNRALHVCQGELIAILEGDDWWPSDKLAVQVDYHLQDKQLIISHGKVIRSDGDQELGEYPRPTFTGKRSSTEYLRMLLLKESCFMPVSVIIRAESLHNIGGFQRYAGYPAVDLPTFRDLVLLPGNVIWIDHNLGFWRQSATQATSFVFNPDVDRINQQFSLQTYEHLSSDGQRQLNLSKSEIYSATQKKIILPGLITAFRNALKQKKRRESIMLANKILRHGNFRNRLLAVVGLAALLRNTDIEKIYNR